MKFIHLSDLHLGKRVNEFSMLPDQQHILSQILSIIDTQKPDAVIIAGDLYDKSVPPAEAVELFDWFLNAINTRKTELFAISGNHDSPERMGFGASLMDRSGVHFSPVYDGKAKCFVMSDEYGECRVHLLPFIKPANVRRFFDDRDIQNYSDALDAAIGAMNIDNSVRNILVAHQFVTGAARCDSEDISAGGLDSVDAEVFNCFDYVALGHIHGPQNAGKSNVRYCGTPLKYSFSEAKHQKSVTVVEILQKGNINITTVPLKPLHDMREIKGSYMQISAKSFYDGTATDDFLHITLTDEEDIPDAISKLRAIYPNIMRLDYDNKRTRTNSQIDICNEALQKTPFDMFSDFYELQNNKPLTETQADFVHQIIQKLQDEQ